MPLAVLSHGRAPCPSQGRLGEQHCWCNDRGFCLAQQVRVNCMRATGVSSKTEENWHFAVCFSKTNSIASQGSREGGNYPKNPVHKHLFCIFLSLKTPYTRTYSVLSFPLQKEIYLILSTFFSSCS